MDASNQPEFPALVIDGSGSAVFVGILDSELKWIAQTHQDGAPLEYLFPTVKDTLESAGLKLCELRSFIYCEGPGSVLGLRLCAMAIETWSHLYPHTAKYFSYNTLQFCAQLISQNLATSAQALLVSDWKKGAWNAVIISSGKPGTTTVMNDEAIAKFEGPVYHLPQRKGWQKPPENASTLNYKPEHLQTVLESDHLLTPTNGVELYSSGVNTFQKWTADRHRAPSE